MRAGIFVFYPISKASNSVIQQFYSLPARLGRYPSRGSFGGPTLTANCPSPHFSSIIFRFFSLILPLASWVSLNK